MTIRTQPAISVVVPCYNAGAFIDGLLDTLARQTFRDFETIIVDDGSTDASTAKRLSSLDHAITVIHQRNGGPSAARNAGIKAARAEIILVLDCDDSIERTFLEEAFAVLSRSPGDVGYVFSDMRLSGLNRQIVPQRFKLFDQLFVNRIPCCLLLRKTAWAISDGYDEMMLDGFEDWEFTIALAKAGFRGVRIPKPLFVYRVNEEGRMMSRAAMRHGDLWAYIRRKHRSLYRPSAVARLWWASRSMPGEITLFRAAALLTLATVLPMPWLNRLFFLVRRRRLAQRQIGQVPQS